jgi:hypothetical protein
MAELLKTKKRSLRRPTWLAYGIPPNRPEGPKLVKGRETETLDNATAVPKPTPLFSESEMGDFRA